MNLRSTAIATLVAVTLSAAEKASELNLVEESRRWWAHVEMLASDKLEGRDIGSPGYATAARYVSQQFEKAGLKPGATATSYLQNVRLIQRQIDESQSSLALIRDGKSEPLTLGEHANIAIRNTFASKVEAEMVFVGYGAKIPEANYDDLKDVDLKGKIAVYLAGQPAGINGPLASHYMSAGERNRALIAAGAIGTAVINNPRTTDIPWARATLARLMPTMSLDEKTPSSERLKIAISINPAHADKFLAGSGHTFVDLLMLAADKKPLPHFPLTARLSARAAVKQSKVSSDNVIGIREGSDPILKNEFIVVTAHLDHLGIDNQLPGDKIYNGAMDNASGVASLIEAARHLNEANVPLKRSIAFIALTGEEKGLLGSTYYAQHPVFGLQKHSRVVGNLNMDMYLPLFPLKALVILGVDESTLGDLARQGAIDAGIEVWPDPAPERNSFVRSDQYSFIRNGTPALAFKFGYQKGSPEEKTIQTWLKDRYHAPGDDLNQPLDKEAAAQYNRVLTSMIRSAANSTAAPQWKDASFFKRFAKN